ncbi:Sec-independent protein translocase protein TatB [Glaesserella parasuis]|uniref:Sec-independent protein translocase protein TatB n=1 Tax=Glaesserella parasuis TaxID=738 RepID=A0AA42EIA2_GLAPU|nr:Sec-independent protein translocase protein TatB [Glaesserella parasuis]EQA01802.1 twin arginine-targeting protein translocase TatB [Glaesserella parasuis SW114]AIK90150.1 preprotein translocase subunit TatB [Glaesserella parasuis]AMW16281.1 sec-independent translocase [Glaesserella parasuis]ATW42621.1 twin arginine-targeting protein translocase TatB [Glaesserella parasuis D74]AWY46255.1 twin-arginine translocase subunit TatB [Glaesserella parasuis 29755]
MFDIGFSELVLVFIVGLVVLGPKRLPIAIRTVMGWVRTIRGLAANVQNELSQELKLQELQESIKKAEELNLSKLSPELSKTVEELKQSAQKMQANLDSARGQIESLTQEQVNEIQNKIEQESQQLSQQAEQQKETENPPLETETLSADRIAELAEADEDKLTAYYPPDDDLASVEPKTKQDK